MNVNQITYPLRDRWSYLWLLIGTVMTLFGTGQWTIPLLTWLGGIFVIRFMRTQPVWRGSRRSLSLVLYVGRGRSKRRW